MNDEEKVEETKEKAPKKIFISSRTAVKGLINGFVSYGVLIIFIFLAIAVLCSWIINNNRDVLNYEILKYTLPIIGSILIFFLIRGICKLSTYDLFKKCKIKKENVDEVCTKMNFFYICLVAFSVFFIIIYLTTRFSNEAHSIDELADKYYKDGGSSYAAYMETNMLEEFEANKLDSLIGTTIIESGLILGLFSLITNQKRLVERYNTK